MKTHTALMGFFVVLLFVTLIVSQGSGKPDKKCDCTQIVSICENGSTVNATECDWAVHTGSTIGACTVPVVRMLPFPQGTIAYWPMNGTFRDYTSNALDLTGNSAVLFDSETAVFGRSSFHVTNIANVTAAAQLTSPSFAPGVQAFTYAIWVNDNHNEPRNSAYGEIGTGCLDPNQWLLYYNGGLGQLKVSTQNIDAVSIPQTASVWHRYVVVRELDQHTIRLYEDGLLAGTGSIPNDLSATEFSIGNSIGGLCGDQPSPDFFVQEAIYVIGSAWNATQVEADYNGGAGVIYT